MKKSLLCCFAGAVLLSALSGCRGAITEKRPIHINPNLDFQAKFKAQTYSQHPPSGTVVWGSVLPSKQGRDAYLKEDSAFYRGKTQSGDFLSVVPLPVTKELMERGQERYNIYCAMCHDQAGTGQGPVIKRGFVPPPNFSDESILAYKDGQLYDVISNGIRNMPGYKTQIPEEDRWAIVAYVRALQKTRTASADEIK